MSASPRSAVLGSFHFNAAVTTVVAFCDEGFTLIVKDIRISNVNSAAVVANMWIGSSGTTLATTIVRESLDPNALFSLPAAWIVLGGGQFLGFQCSSGGLDLWISGTVLTGTANYTQPPQPAQLPGPAPALTA